MLIAISMAAIPLSANTIEAPKENHINRAGELDSRAVRL